VFKNTLGGLSGNSRTLKSIFGIMLILLGMTTLAFNIRLALAEPATIHVDDDNTTGPWDGTAEHPYQNITSGLENAQANDKIFVHSGTYYETVDITEPIRLTGEDAENTIIDGGSYTSVDLHGTDNAILERFTIKGREHLIFGDGANNNTIRRNIILLSGSSSRGIELRESVYNHIYNNNITEIGDMQPCMHGIKLGYEHGELGSRFNFIYGNHIENNDVAIEISYSTENTIYHNNIVNSTDVQADVNPDCDFNIWDDGYPSGGNYWSDWNGTGTYFICDDNEDHYPLTSGVTHNVALINVTASPTEAYDGENVNVTVVAENKGNRVKETFDVTAHYDDVPIGTQTVEELGAGENTTLTFQWDTSNVPEGNYTMKAKAENVGPLEKQTLDNTYIGDTVEVHQTIRYMQNAKWDSTYWKQLWNNTETYTSQARTMFGEISRAYLGIKVYNETNCISGASVIQVGYWTEYSNEIQSTTWNCGEYNVTGSYIKIEIWYKFHGYDWTSMNVAFKTETFTQNTVLNSTTWTIYFYGYFYQWEPRAKGPPSGVRSTIIFRWGSSSKESRIENMSFFTY